MLTDFYIYLINSDVYNTIYNSLKKVFGTIIPIELLFDGKIKKEHLSKEVFKEITDRYKDSIDDVNQKIVFTIIFAFIALYVYFILPETESVKFFFCRYFCFKTALDKCCSSYFIWTIYNNNYIISLVYGTQKRNKNISQ